ncbi:MAG: carboxypeptidase regulatory-like domain-containing protein, partial [Planctomycetes bacterium]|nr:carboxypeptidase regulatory-like domain-containing protein [Planctomycetota bacterium]
MNKGLGLVVGVLAVAAVVAGVFMLSGSDEDDTGGAAPLAASRRAPAQAPGFDAPLDGAQPVAAQPLAAGSGVTPSITPEAQPDAASAAARPAGEALTLSGRVLDEAGRPVPGARVTFVAEPLQARLVGRIPGGRAPRSPVEDLPSVETGPDGRFALDGVLPPPSGETGNFILPGLQPVVVVQH